jgi:hypothetical protein
LIREVVGLSTLGNNKSKKMSQDTTKFYNYSTSTSASLTIPKRSARQLGWFTKEEESTNDVKKELSYEIKEIEGNRGLFLYINKKDSVKLKLYKYKTSTSPTVTIPLDLAEDLKWGHKDDVIVSIQTIDGNMGLFFYKNVK